MNWLNIETATLDSEEFVGSDPVTRATWLCLLRYCCGQENGGVILGCKSWSDRKWQQLARVTQAEVLAESALWIWEGENLHLWAYPTDREIEVQHRRERARTNGLKGGRPTNNPPAEQKKPTSETNEKPTLVHFAKAEGEEKRREEKIKEGEEKEKEKPNAPDGAPLLLVGEETAISAKPPAKTPAMRRVELLFRRRETTPWDKSEQRAWKDARVNVEQTSEEDWKALTSFYAFEETTTHVVYRRQSLDTLLNNWSSEIDKARQFVQNGPKAKAGVNPQVAAMALAREDERKELNARYQNSGF